MHKNKEKFSNIYDQHAPKIYRFIFLKVSSKETAEDLSAEVFSRTWNVYMKKEEIKNIQAYLYQIARNVVADHYREKGKYKAVSIESGLDIPEQGSTLEQQAGISLEMERVAKALKSLSGDYQDFIIWRYLDELSVDEIAQIIGKSKESVRVGVHRALQVLKTKLSLVS